MMTDNKYDALIDEKNPEELFDLTGEDVLKAIGTFPKEEAHCAFLAVKTMQEAVNAYLVKQTGQK